MNLHTVAMHTKSGASHWFNESRIIAGDGTAAAEVLTAVGITTPSVAFLHLDPARPRNSRTHDLSEMQPPLHSVLASWAPMFSPSDDGPAVLLDLSPRLTGDQRGEVEAIVNEVWPDITMTWEWTSRGRGRVDRLALWLGGIASKDAKRRFVRVPRSLAETPLVLSTDAEREVLACRNHPPKRGEYVSLLDAALIESGLATSWLANVAGEDDVRWASVEGRRPQVHHDHPLKLEANDRWLVQASGRVVEVLNFQVDETTVDLWWRWRWNIEWHRSNYATTSTPRSSRFCKVRLTGN